MHAGNNGKQWEIWDKKNLTGLRRDSSFFDGTFDAERGFDRTLAKTEGPTELAQLVIVSRRTLTRVPSKEDFRVPEAFMWIILGGTKSSRRFAMLGQDGYGLCDDGGRRIDISLIGEP